MFESRSFFEEWYAFRHCWWRFVYETEDSPRNNTIGSSKAYQGSWFFGKKMEDCYKNIEVAYRILLTISVSVATAERSFSKLKLIKNYLQTTMPQKRLNGLAMLSIEMDMVERLDYTSLMNDFAGKNARRSIFQQ